MRAEIVLGLALCAMSVIGCDSSDGSQRVPDQPVDRRTGGQPSAMTSAAPYADEDLAVPPDFEAEADEQITEDNYEDKLAEIEEAMGVTHDAGTDGGTASDEGAKADAGAKPAPAGKPTSAPKAPAPKPPSPPKPKPKSDWYD